MYKGQWPANLNLKFYHYHSLFRRDERPDIVIRLSNKGSISSVGIDAKIDRLRFEKSMTLGILGQEASRRRKLILHEFGHALGLLHEHQHHNRPFRYTEAFKDNCQKEGRLEDCMTQRIGLEGNTSFSYDSRSIMHYFIDEKDIIFTGDDDNEKKEIQKARTDLSLIDKIGISLYYPGRISASSILAEAKREKKRTTVLNYGNCYLIRGEGKKRDQLSYGLKSPWDYKTPFIETSLKEHEYAMKKDPFCFSDAQELRWLLRARRKKQDAERTLGRCEIVASEEESKKGHPSINKAYPYRIKLLWGDDKDNLFHFVFPIFENALKHLKMNADICEERL